MTISGNTKTLPTLFSKRHRRRHDNKKHAEKRKECETKAGARCTDVCNGVCLSKRRERVKTISKAPLMRRNNLPQVTEHFTGVGRRLFTANCAESLRPGTLGVGVMMLLTEFREGVGKIRICLDAEDVKR